MKKQIKKILSMLFMFVMFVCTVAGCGDKEVTNLKVKEGTLVYVYKEDAPYSFDNLKLIATYNDGSTQEVGKDDITISSFSTDNVGSYKVTFTYEGKELSVTLKVTNNDDELYGVYALLTPTTITNIYNKNKEEKTEENKRTEFYDRDNNYVVGDDNAYKFMPEVIALNEDGNPITITAFRSDVTVYKEDDTTHEFVELTKEVTNEELKISTYKLGNTEYVVVDSFNQTYDFTDDAVNETFKIKVMPYYKNDGTLDSDVTVEHVFDVVNGYNVTEAKQLGLLNNDTTDYMYQYWDAFLSDVEKPQGELQGIVLHNNINITSADVPSTFFDNNGKLIDQLGGNTDIYYHKAVNDKTFNFYGNYFTIDASSFPLIHLANETSVSHSTLFNFTADEATSESKFENTFTNIKDLSLIGNSNRTNTTTGFGGLIALKVSDHTASVDNVIVKTFYLNLYSERKYTAFNINNTKSYDAYQNTLFMWGGGTTNITHSELKDAGGPLMILQNLAAETGDCEDDDTCDPEMTPIVTVDEFTGQHMESWVTGGEAWFTKILGVTDGTANPATQILGMGTLLTNDTFVKDGKMNLIAVNMGRGESITSMEPAGGKLEINGKAAVDFTGVAGETINQVIAGAEIEGVKLPVFKSSEGGIGVFVPQPPINGWYTTIEPEKLAQGDYIGLYYLGLGITLGYIHNTSN